MVFLDRNQWNKAKIWIQRKNFHIWFRECGWTVYFCIKLRQQFFLSSSAFKQMHICNNLVSNSEHLRRLTVLSMPVFIYHIQFIECYF
jgi:hypothetical protein